jgi:hypothetical protein
MLSLRVFDPPGLAPYHVGDLDSVELSIMMKERSNKRPDVHGTPRGRPHPVDMVEGTWVWGGVPEKLDEGHPFASRQMRPCLQDGLKNEEGSVLVGGLDDTGNARYRGKVEVFGGHDGWCARDDSGIVVVRCGEMRYVEFCAILKSSSQETIDSSLNLCKNFLADK